MPYEKMIWDETVPVTPARLNNLETQYEKALADYPKPLNYDDRSAWINLTVGPGKMYTRIQDAVDALKNINASKRIITIDPGEYAETVSISDFHGAEINIVSSTGVRDSIKVLWNVYVNKCTAQIWLYDFNVNIGDQTFLFEFCSHIYLGRSTKSAINTNTGRGIVGNNIQKLVLDGCVFGSQSTGVELMQTICHMTNVSGTGNQVGISATNGSLVSKIGGVTITGTTPTFISGGSQILG